MNETDEMKVLLDFCINNNDFDELLSILNEFNPLKILKSEESELKHSNILAWLLSPKAHHGLGDTIFKKLVCGILKDNDGGISGIAKSLQINEVLASDYSDIEIFREYENIDILAVSPSKKLCWL